MEVILAKDVPKLGKVGETVKVKSGYARNYLLPQGLARIATLESMKEIGLERKRALRQEENKLAELKAMAEKIEGKSFTIEVEAHENGTLFGSVTAHMVSDVAKADGVDIDPKWVVLREAIKELGIYSLEVRLHASVSAKIRAWVVAKGSAET